MSTPRERIASALLELTIFGNQIPRDMRMMFETSGIRLEHWMYAPAPQRAPCSALVKGRPCKNKCCFGTTMCGIHNKAAQRATNPPTPVARCTGLTAKGDRCKCRAYKATEMCKRHARQNGKLPDVPAECPICYEGMTKENRVETSCNHYFHQTCLRTYVTTAGHTHLTRRGTEFSRGPCPMCRAPFTLRLPAPA